MELSRPPLVVTFELSAKRKAIVTDALAGASAVVYLTELDEAARAEALRNTGVLLTFKIPRWILRQGSPAPELCSRGGALPRLCFPSTVATAISQAPRCDAPSAQYASASAIR
jgi:hypothetical protein